MDIEFRLDELEAGYLSKLDHLENLILNLRRIIKEFEIRFDDKQKELNTLKANTELGMNTLKSDLEAKQSELARLKAAQSTFEAKSKKSVKIYEPSEFRDEPIEYNPADYNRCLNELNGLQSKLAAALNQLKGQDQEQEVIINQIKKAYEVKFNDLNRQHKCEIEQLLKVFTGGAGLPVGSAELSSDSPLNDPIQMRLLLNARDRHNETKQTIEKQKELINQLYFQCSELAADKEKYQVLEEAHKNLLEQVNELKCELDEARNMMGMSQKQTYEFIKERIKKIEHNFVKREKELKNLITNEASSGGSFVGGTSEAVELKRFYEAQLDNKNKEIRKFRLEFEAILQLLYSLS